MQNIDLMDRLGVEKWMELNAKLQTKKNVLRKLLSAKGVLKREGQNAYDKYKYFSEAQYKELFTELMSEAKLELKFEEIDYLTFDGPEKQANGRMPKLEFTLFDTETGFFETTHITGEGIDKGDKAGYKAYTGALKYYLANTFMVATGDDPEKDSPDNKMNDVQSNGRKEKTMNTPVIVEDIKKEKATEKQVNTIMKLLSEDDVARCLSFYSIETLNDLTISQASAVIKNFSKGAKQ